MNLTIRFTLLSICLLMINGCALLRQASVGKYERRVVAFEKARPDRAELQRGELRGCTKVIKNMNDWRSYIDLRSKNLTRGDKQELMARVDRAKQRFLLQAAAWANNSNLAYYLAKIALLINPTDDRILRLVRTYGKGRNVFRQTMFDQTGTYRHSFKKEMVWRTTSSAHHVSGNRRSSRVSRRLVQRVHNCVFSTKPFGREGVKNSGLSYYFKGSQKIHGRCYANRSAGYFRGYRGGFVLRIPYGVAGRFTKNLALRSSVSGRRKHFDFVLSSNDLARITRSRKPHLDIKVTLLFVGYNDNKIVWIRGRRRLRPDWKTFVLGSSNLFWER